MITYKHPDITGRPIFFQDFFEVGMDREVEEILPMPSYARATILNVGCGNKHIHGTIGLDYPTWDADTMPLPYDDATVGGIHAYHFLEHVKDPVAMLLEFQRVLRAGGIVNIVVPYYKSQMQAHDLDHKHVFCEDTWKILFKNPYYNKNKIEWKFDIGFNMIAGIVERNLALFTQLVKRP